MHQSHFLAEKLRMHIQYMTFLLHLLFTYIYLDLKLEHHFYNKQYASKCELTTWSIVQFFLRIKPFTRSGLSNNAKKHLKYM